MVRRDNAVFFFMIVLFGCCLEGQVNSYHMVFNLTNIHHVRFQIPLLSVDARGEK